MVPAGLPCGSMRRSRRLPVSYTARESPGSDTGPNGRRYSFGPLPLRPICHDVSRAKSTRRTSCSPPSTTTRRPSGSSATPSTRVNGSVAVVSGVAKAGPCATTRDAQSNATMAPRLRTCILNPPRDRAPSREHRMSLGLPSGDAWPPPMVAGRHHACDPTREQEPFPCPARSFGCGACGQAGAIVVVSGPGT